VCIRSFRLQPSLRGILGSHIHAIRAARKEDQERSERGAWERQAERELQLVNTAHNP